MMDSPRKLVEEVLSAHMTREVWSGNYDKALPFSLLDFELSAILPAVFYMFRFGQRRGAGEFLKTYGLTAGSVAQRRRSATIARVSEILAHDNDLEGFDGETERAILGDLLLCFCLENVRHSLGREEQIQRVAPTHYMASWIDLPSSVAHLRHVPEMIVALLAEQKGEHVEPSEDGGRTRFPVGRGYEYNVLMHAFSQGMERRGKVLDDRKSDRFNEEDGSVGLDQLLMIRLAQQLEAAPDGMRGKQGGRISNQRPIAEKAARDFSEDLRRFVRSYARSTPRHAFTEMLESCISIGITTIVTSAVEMLFPWCDTGEVPDRRSQQPTQLFVDCSNGVDRHVRARAEQSMDDFMRRLDRFPIVLMMLRLLDFEARHNRSIKRQNVQTRPYATAWLNLLGDVLHDRHPETSHIFYSIEDKAEKLAENLAEEYPEAASILGDDQQTPPRRLAEGLMTLMGPKLGRKALIAVIDSGLLAGRPNGLAVKRRTTRHVHSGGNAARRTRDVRSLVFTDSVLDYLVHLHLLPGGSKRGVRTLSFREFIGILRERYGFHVDAAPTGMTISNELLQKNRMILERRLRDLGLLMGVNDAEAMKRLLPRFEPAMED